VNGCKRLHGLFPQLRLSPLPCLPLLLLVQGFSNYYPGWASQCLPDAPKCEGTAKCPPGVPCNNGAPCTPGSPCSGIDETPNLRPPTVHWDRPKPCATCPKPTCKPCEHPDPPPSTARKPSPPPPKRKPSPPPPKRKPSPLPNCAATCMAKDGWNPVSSSGVSASCHAGGSEQPWCLIHPDCVCCRCVPEAWGPRTKAKCTQTSASWR
jgi:hypothetical protein